MRSCNWTRALYQAITVVCTCGLVSIGIALSAGVLELRRPEHNPLPSKKESPKPYIQRDRAAEQLLSNRNPGWVYKFAGGLPSVWVEIDSEGHNQTIGPWCSVSQPKLLEASREDWPLVETAEGYIALFRPTSEEQT
jgi:hypothetical protein